MNGLLKNMKIGTKLIVLTSLLAVAVMAALTVVTLSRVGEVTEKDASEIAEATAAHYAALVKSELEIPLDEARALAGILQGAATVEGLRMPRRKVNMLLEDFIEQNTDFLAVYVSYEPNAFDGRDANFVDEWGHDSSGRFIPYWSRNEQGQGVLEPLVDYDEFNQNIKERGRETVLDPYSYPIQGKEVLITSLVVPMFKGQEFIGTAGVDIGLSKLQALVQNAEIGTYGKAYGR